MKIAKRTLFVSTKDLHELFGLPEDVEIMAIRTKADNGGYEFLLASAGEVEINGHKVTEFQDNEFGLYRRISLSTLKIMQNANNIVNQINMSDDSIIITAKEISIDGAKQVAKEIMKAQKRGTNNDA